MAHEQNSTALPFTDILHLTDGFLLELGVTHGENLVNDENFRIQMSGNCKTQTDFHT